MENAVKPENKAWTLLKKAGRRYGLDALSAMALGLFSSLIIGLILDQISKIPYMGWLAEFAAILAASSPVVGAALCVLSESAGVDITAPGVAENLMKEKMGEAHVDG